MPDDLGPSPPSPAPAPSPAPSPTAPQASPAAASYVLSITRVHLRPTAPAGPSARGFDAAARQMTESPGFVMGSVRRQDARTFWTLSLWRDLAAMAGFRNANPHRTWMGNVEALCDESAWLRLPWPTASLPAWPEAAARLAAEAHFTRMADVSPLQAAGRIPPGPLGTVRALRPALAPKRRPT